MTLPSSTTGLVRLPAMAPCRQGRCPFGGAQKGPTPRGKYDSADALRGEQGVSWVEDRWRRGRARGGAGVLSPTIARNRPTHLVSERKGGTNMGIWASSASIERVSFGNRGGRRRVHVAFMVDWKSNRSSSRRFSLRGGDLERRPLESGRVQELHPKQLTRPR